MDDRYYILYDNKSKVCWVSKEAIAFTTDDDILYSLDGAEITIIGYTGNEQIITIPSTIDGYPVTAIGEKAFEDENIAGIYIPATVKEIGSNAFAFCSLDGALVIPDSVTYIGSGAFHDCYNLDSLTLSEGMTSIESDTFAASGFSGNLYIPEGITNIQENAFKYCNNLQAVYISPNVTEIGIDAFPSSITIYGVSGSYAETYAAENGIAFSTAPFPGTETEPDEETVTLSGSVTLADGTPVEDAYIYVYDTIAEDWIGLEYTDRNGAWACSVPADGSYTVHYLHDVYTIEPAEVSVSPAADMTLDTAIASLVGGEGMATPVFAMQMNGAEIPAAGVKVGDVVTFSITAEGATKVRLVADGVAYNEYWLTDGSATIERSFTHAGTRQIAFQAYDGSDWGAVCEAQTLIVTADGTLDAPVIHAIDTQYVGESFTVTWNAVENAESYTVYLYRNELLWPALSNTDRSTTTGLSMEIPGDLLYTDGEYLIEIIASGYGYSQSSSSVKFTVEETAAGVEITYPTDGMTYSVGDTMHTRYAMGSGTQGVRLLVAPPVGEPVLYAPDESGIFYPIADQVGDYVLTPYYSTSEGDFTAETADGAGESVTVTVQKPAISSLTQGTNKQYSIRYTGTAQDFAGSVSNVRYTVKVYLNDALVQEITPEDGEFAFTTDTLTETGKYVYAFVPCYGDIEGEPKEFPVYMVEQETESVTKYAGEPMLLLGAPDGSVKASLAYGAEVTILGTYSEEYLYVSANGKDGFIAAGSRLVEALEPSEMDINVECLTDVPYTKLGENRQYKITVNGAKAVYAKVRKPGTNADTYEAETGTDGFTVTIPAQNTGVYIATFHAVTMDDQEVHYTYSMPFLMVDASGTNVGKECWSNHSKMLPDAMSIYTQSDAEFDVTTCKMHVIGTINNDLVCVQRTMNDGSLKYAVVDASKIQYTKNKTVYRAVCVVNLYKLNTYKGDPCERTCENMIRCLQHIDNIQIWSAIAKDREGIDLKLSTVKALADYNDVTYIYWTGHGGEYNGESAHYWGILPIKDNGEHSSYGYGALCEYFALDLEDESDSLWEGKINAVFDSCFSGDFVTILENEYVNYPDFLYVPDTLSILMATEKGVRGAYAPEIGSLFPKALLEYVQSSTDEQLTLRRIKDNVISSYEENNKIIVSYSPSIWGDSNRIFFAEDPDAVN